MLKCFYILSVSISFLLLKCFCTILNKPEYTAVLTHLNSVIANLSSPTIRDKMYRSTSQDEYKTESLCPGRQSVCDKRPDQNSREMKIYYLLSVLIILLAVSSSQQRSIALKVATAGSSDHLMRSIADIRSRHREEAGAGATPWSVEHIMGEMSVMSVMSGEGETIAEATPWP